MDELMPLPRDEVAFAMMDALCGNPAFMHLVMSGSDTQAVRAQFVAREALMYADSMFSLLAPERPLASVQNLDGTPHVAPAPPAPVEPDATVLDNSLID